MNIKEQFRKILNEFTVDKDGKPVYPSNEDDSGVGGVAQKYGYSKDTHYVRSSSHKDQPHTVYSRHIKGYGRHAISHYDDGSWEHEGPNSSVISRGKSSEDLKKHLSDF